MTVMPNINLHCMQDVCMYIMDDVCHFDFCFLFIQLNEDLEDSRSEVQKYKKQLQRSEQTVHKLEEELSQVKTLKRRQSDVIQAEDFKEEIDR